MSRWVALGIVCGALALPQLSSAQDPDVAAGVEGREWEFVLAGSGRSDNDFDNNGVSAQGSLGYFFNDNLELVFRQGINFSDIDGADDVTIANTRAALDFHFDFGRLAPFVGVNFGAFYGNGIDDTWAAGPEAGVKWFVRPNTFLMVLGEYQVLFDDADDFDDNFDDSEFVWTIGMGFNW